VVAGQAKQQRMELAATLGVERRKQFVLHFVDQGAEANQLSAALGGQPDVVAAAVVRIPLPFDEPAFLEPVEDAYQLAAIDRERVRDARLRLARLFAEHSEHAVVVLVVTGRFELFHGASPEVGAEAHYQEPALGQQLVRDPRRLAQVLGTHCDAGHEMYVTGPPLSLSIVDLPNDIEEKRMASSISLAEPESESGSDPRRWLALAVIVAAQFMVVLDVAIVNVALPSIQTDLGFSPEGLQWVITSYAIFFGGVLLLGGRLADLLGRRRLFMAGLVLFTVSSLLDGLSWSAGSLIAFRSLQGLGAALLSPAALSILTTTFREGKERNLALGVWGAASGSGGAAGVLLGGALTSTLDWTWIFFINVPAGILVLAASPWLLRESRADLEHRNFDVAGAASITSALMLLVYGMTRATQHGWATTTTVALLASSASLMIAFLAIETRSSAPLLPMRIFRLRTLTASNISGLLMGGAIFSQFFLLTLYMQQVLHYSALKTGVAYIALTLSIISFSAISQALVTRLGVRRVLPAGLVLSATALVLFARLPVHGHYLTDLLPAFLLSGIGLALAFVPMSIGGLTGVRPADAGVASGLITTSQQIGGAIGVAAATTIATTFTSRFVNAHPGASALSGDALTHGFQIAFYVLAALALLGALVAALLVESKPQVPEVESAPEPDLAMAAIA
jgi:EmrB/QacA subfamily drug resistance transporter